MNPLPGLETAIVRPGGVVCVSYSGDVPTKQAELLAFLAEVKTRRFLAALDLPVPDGLS